MIDFSDLNSKVKGSELSKFANTERKVMSVKDELIEWYSKGIERIDKKGLKLDNIKNTNGLYERECWSRVGKGEDSNKVKIRSEVRGKNVFFSEKDCRENLYFKCVNDKEKVREFLVYLKNKVSNEDRVSVWYKKTNTEKYIDSEGKEKKRKINDEYLEMI